MTHPLVRKLHRQRAWVAKLEAEAERMMAAQLASLPEDYGFATAAEFISAVIEASGKPKRPRRAAAKPRKAAPRRPQSAPKS